MWHTVKENMVGVKGLLNQFFQVIKLLISLDQKSLGNPFFEGKKAIL